MTPPVTPPDWDLPNPPQLPVPHWEPPVPPWSVPMATCRVQDGAQDVLVVAALQDNLHIPLQQPRLREEFGFSRERLRHLRVSLALEGGTLRDRGHSEDTQGLGWAPKPQGEAGKPPWEEAAPIPQLRGCLGAGIGEFV